ncbi:MAG: hypothetical protein M1837_000994 [Sclerophora amabilis]|nr:MAG: hypothetical protein M1837_000994 [Sclerophora amabilis]
MEDAAPPRSSSEDEAGEGEGAGAHTRNGERELHRRLQTESAERGGDYLRQAAPGPSGSRGGARRGAERGRGRERGRAIVSQHGRTKANEPRTREGKTYRGPSPPENDDTEGVVSAVRSTGSWSSPRHCRKDNPSAVHREHLLNPAATTHRAPLVEHRAQLESASLPESSIRFARTWWCEGEGQTRAGPGNPGDRDAGGQRTAGGGVGELRLVSSSRIGKLGAGLTEEGGDDDDDGGDAARRGRPGQRALRRARRRQPTSTS